MEPTVAESELSEPAGFGPPLVCPACRAGVERTEAAYVCTGCSKQYPILEEIPDFRLFPDRFLSIADDRAKARRVIETAADASSSTLLDAYYALTPEMPAAEAARYRAREQAEERAGEMTWREIEQGFTETAAPTIGTPVLDLGCGTGGLVIAAARRGCAATGVDAALRRLIIARARLREAGVGARLVCANAEHLPFAEESFGVVAAVDLMEHVAEPAEVFGECRRVIAPRGTAYVAGNNRYSWAPEPHVRLWGVGLLPPWLQRHYVRSLRGHPYHRVRLLSAGDTLRHMRDAGFTDAAVSAAPLFAAHLGPPARGVATIYNSVRTRSLGRAILRLCAPRIQCTTRAPDADPKPLTNQTYNDEGLR